MDQPTREYLGSFLIAHGNDTPFWWHGGPWGTLETPIQFGVGDGARTEFFLPNRHIMSGLTVYADDVAVSPQPMLDAAPGLVTFSVAPASAAILTASYVCRYKVLCMSEQATLFAETRLSYPAWQLEGLRLREVEV